MKSNSPVSDSFASSMNVILNPIVESDYNFNVLDATLANDLAGSAVDVQWVQLRQYRY